MRRLIENLSSMLWFIMDVCWMSDQDTLAAILIVPTVYSTMLMFWHADYHLVKVLVCIATNAWVIMNVCWMLPDISGAGWVSYVFALRWVFMIIGALAMLIIMATDFNNLKNLKRFR